ncbi:MAG TPA: hypothetical protein VH440_03520 [Candidatus Limnocylindrales bacterium]
MATTDSMDRWTGPKTRPAGIAHGPGHLVVYGNPAFREMFGDRAIGMPARETMLDLPHEAFDLLDAVLREGRPLARWIRRDGHDWRLTVVPRRETDSDEVHGVAFHLRERNDVPILPPD